MTWNGYFSANGVEVINATRTEAYAKRSRLGWFRPIYNNTALPLLLSDTPYNNPAVDGAIWYEPEFPESAEFYGVYPLDVTGADDSTFGGTAIESLADGGTLTGSRNGTKSTVFNVLLIGASEAGVEYGLQWLKRALLGRCSGQFTSCVGFDLTYFASEPVLGAQDSATCGSRLAPRTNDPVKAANQLVRTLRRSQVLNGPAVNSKRKTTDGGCVWNVGFTILSGSPFEFGAETVFMQHWLDPLYASPWPGGTAPSGASITGPVSYDAGDEECLPREFSPLYDPLCPGVTAPPPPAAIEWLCYFGPDDDVWRRYTVVIPKSFVPGWQQVNPIIHLTTLGDESRNVRIRFYPDPLRTGVVDPDDPCGFEYEFIVSYLPDGSSMTIDGRDEIVYVDDTLGNRRRADSLVFASDGRPPDWVGLTCDQQYVMTVDFDPTQTIVPSVGVSFVERYG